MNEIIWLLLGLAVACAGLYFLYPQYLVSLVVGAVRRWGRMSEKSVV